MLLYAGGDLPERAEIERIIASEESISIAGISVSGMTKSVSWRDHPACPNFVTELVKDGLSFDVLNASKSLEDVLPQLDHNSIADPLLLPRIDRALIVKAGPHITAANGNFRVIKSQFAIANILLQAQPQPQAIVWLPSLVMSLPEQVQGWIEPWLAGGKLPSPLLVACHREPDEGLRTIGLDFLIGQEIRIEPELIVDQTQAIQLAMQLFDRFARQGRLESSDVLTGNNGESLAVEPSANGRFIRVRAG